MAFGSGALIAALTLILMEPAYEGGGFGTAAAGFIAGALAYTAADVAIRRWGGKRHEAAESGLAIAAGSLIDNVPEGAVIGISLIGGAVNPVMLAAVFVSNLPEALAAPSSQ